MDLAPPVENLEPLRVAPVLTAVLASSVTRGLAIDRYGQGERFVRSRLPQHMPP